MMRLSLLALAACSGGSMDMSCPMGLESEVVHLPGVVRSGPTFAGVTWAKRYGSAVPETRGAMLMLDGTLSADVLLPQPDMSGTPGAATMLWYPRGKFEQNGYVLSATLQRGGDTSFVEIAHDVAEHSIVFDGTSYQLFWRTPINAVLHRSLSEDGVLGPLHVIQGGPQQFSMSSIAAATDGAGTTFFKLFDDGYLFDTATGQLQQRIFDGAGGVRYGTAFFFDGSFHVVEEALVPPRIFALLPTGPEFRFLPQAAGEPTEFHATPNALYVRSIDQMTEVDTSFELGHRFTLERGMNHGMLGDNVLDVARRELDPGTLEPGGMYAIRRSASGDVWRVDLAVDSPLYPVEYCEAL